MEDICCLHLKLTKRDNYSYLREYDTVERVDNYFAEYRMLFSRCRGNDIVG